MPLIDLDVHNELRDHKRDLLPYFTSGWQDYIQGFEWHKESGPVAVPPSRNFCFNPGGSDRKDALPPDGAMAGSDPQLIIDQLIDPYNIEHAVLTAAGGIGFSVSTHSNPYFAAAVASAANDHLVDHWLSYDRRFHGSILTSIQVPEWAAKEIFRHADNPRMIQTLVAANPLPYGFGHPLLDPIHRACAETGRPLAIHSLGDGAAGSIPSALAGAWPSYYLEFHSGAFQAMVTHLMSFICHGVFERYPQFRLVLIESGVSWIPGVLARMDADFKGTRREVPWCKKLPSEYFLEKVTVATQPLDIAGPDDPLVASLARLGAENVLAFSSDYPHWDTDTPSRSISLLPLSWRAKVRYENAARLYNLPSPVTTGGTP